jgi:hypothetical protein
MACLYNIYYEVVLKSKPLVLSDRNVNHKFDSELSVCIFRYTSHNIFDETGHRHAPF